MRCSACGAENAASNRFCGGCGARLGLTCPACGQPNLATNRFCGDCGAPLVQQATTAAEARPPDSYTPGHLAQQILASRSALEGERKQVTVLFADLKASTELIQGLDPEDAQQLLDGAVKAMMEAVHHFEGTVNHILGDGLMALFGAPLAHEDHAVRACYAALALQEGVSRYAEQARRRYGVQVQVRVGLNSGEVVVRSIANDLRMDYSAMGPTVHLASRMERLAREGTIRLTSATLALTEGYVEVRSLGLVPVKGLTEPIEVFELLRAGVVRTRLQASAARGLSRFVGRDAELGTLRRALEQAGSRHGQLVALVGEPGVGKSRLVWELTHSHATQDWLVLTCGSVSYGTAASYLPVIDLLKSYCGIDRRDEPGRMRAKLAERLLTLDPALQSTLPAFQALLDLPLEDPAWQALDPPDRRQRTLDAVKRLLLRASQEQPLLLIFEDLHWIDAETQTLLDSLVDSLPTTRIALLVNYRPDYEHSWHRRTYYQQLRLDPLPAVGADELLDALIGPDNDLDPLKRLLIERTEGNPFFLEESVRTLVETGALLGERGAYRLAQAVESNQVPATVQAVLAARIDRLEPEDKRLLQAAAVVGKDVPYALLRPIAELPENALRSSPARLQAAELLYETSLFPDLEYAFKHALTHEVAYGSLLQERRRTLHARIMRAIEQHFPARLAEQLDRLALHALRGGLWAEAVRYSRQAGLRAVGRSASQEAADCFERALAALAHLPESRETMTEGVDLRFDLRRALYPLSDGRRLLECTSEMEVLASALDDPGRLGRALTYEGVCFYHYTGDLDRATDYLHRGLELAESHVDSDLEVLSLGHLGQVHHARGDFRLAAEFCRRTAARIPPERLTERFGMAGNPALGHRALLALALAELGEFESADTAADEAFDLFDVVEGPLARA